MTGFWNIKWKCLETMKSMSSDGEWSSFMKISNILAIIVTFGMNLLTFSIFCKNDFFYKSMKEWSNENNFNVGRCTIMDKFYWDISIVFEKSQTLAISISLSKIKVSQKQIRKILRFILNDSYVSIKIVHSASFYVEIIFIFTKKMLKISQISWIWQSV